MIWMMMTMTISMKKVEKTQIHFVRMMMLAMMSQRNYSKPKISSCANTIKWNRTFFLNKKVKFVEFLRSLVRKINGDLIWRAVSCISKDMIMYLVKQMVKLIGKSINWLSFIHRNRTIFLIFFLSFSLLLIFVVHIWFFSLKIFENVSKNLYKYIYICTHISVSSWDYFFFLCLSLCLDSISVSLLSRIKIDVFLFFIYNFKKKKHKNEKSKYETNPMYIFESKKMLCIGVFRIFFNKIKTNNERNWSMTKIIEWIRTSFKWWVNSEWIECFIDRIGRCLIGMNRRRIERI